MTAQLHPSGILKAADAAIRALPPAWPLDATVAVNPFLGQTDKTLAQAAARLGRVAGLSITPDRAERRCQVATGEIEDADLRAALDAAPADQRPSDLAALRTALATHAPAPIAPPTVAALAAAHSGTDWPGLIAERFSVWAAGWFDEGQALWAPPKADGAFAAWRAFATHDLTPEIAGLQGFAAHVAAAPRSAANAIARATETLGLGDAAVETVYHQLMMDLGGWAQVARYRLWVAELADGQDATALDLLAIRLLWEEALFGQYRAAIEPEWIAARTAHAAPLAPSADQAVDAILQEAAERAAQRRLAQLLTGAEPVSDDRPAVQAAFCIDVRSEVFRRALESADGGVRTLGFAGFFGLGAAHTDFASDVEERRLPVLLNPGVTSRSGGEEDDLAARLRTRAHRAWGRFRLAAVSSFAFVEATGPLYIAKLARDALGLAGPSREAAPAPRFDPALSPEQRIDTAASVLGAMSLTGHFARIVLLAGHGANVVNNPHASALHCGACGGYSGEVNARLLAGLLNDPAVRTGLAARGIAIPDDTLFLAGLHDTTTDAVTLYTQDHPAPDHGADLDQLRRWLGAAGEIARAERAARLPRAETADSVAKRSRDWSETRPEWGLAGCSAFIAAPRAATAAKRLDGRAFLHDYDWGRDEGFGVLELILTAPVVVASWISLQYYGSAVAPTVFGGGDKLLHNVVGGIGVVEGNGGLLRPGLPWQSVHDGEKLVHEPLRLTVAIQAPTDAMTAILNRHPGVKDLFDNRWLHLIALDDSGRMAQRYTGDGGWATFESAEAAAIKAVA